MNRKKQMAAVAVCVVAALFLFFLFQPTESKKYQDADLSTMWREEKRGVFISYLELQSNLLNQQEKGKEIIIDMLARIQNANFNMILLQVRSFSDAIYPSEYFPSSRSVVSKEGDPLPFDYLQFFIEEAHRRNIEVHAWVNPYRIRSSEDASTISIKNPCYKWFDSNRVKVIPGKGIYYNPADEEVRALIVKGIAEILENYDVDGIHFDDYFYPDPSIDDQNYEDYKNQGGTLSHDAYRLEQVNLLVRDVYELAHRYQKVFGISPEGNISNNYESNYIDTKLWMSQDGYIDYIMPQIYFGFENERRPFLTTLAEWNALITAEHVTLMPALAFYKTGQEDTYAFSGKEEWIKHQDIIMKQIIASRSVAKYRGFSLFRYDYFFGNQYETEATLKEKENVLNLLLTNRQK